MGDIRKERIQVNLVIGGFRAWAHLFFAHCGFKKGEGWFDPSKPL